MKRNAGIPEDNVAKLARWFKERENPFQIPIALGEVISTSPLKVQFGDSVILTSEHLVVNKLHAGGFSVQYDDNGVTKSLTIVDPLQQGETVMLIPDSDYKQWFLVGKVGTVT